MKRAYAYMHIAIFLWGFTGILGRAISLDYGQLVWYRMLISALSLGLYIWYKKEWVAPPKKEIVKMLATGSIVAIHWVLFYAAIKFSNVSVTLSCFATIIIYCHIRTHIFFAKDSRARNHVKSFHYCGHCIYCCGTTGFYNWNIAGSGKRGNGFGIYHFQ
ncbi:MAG: DMT family transporter [Bacteroidetes bacterium]|nr:DMT family transporter [Bacteroidota bacterium]